MDSNHAPSLHLAAVVAFRLGDCDLAYALFESAIARRRERTYYLDLIEAYRLEWRLDDAFETARRASGLWPHDGAVAYANGVVALDRVATGEAITHFRRALVCDPGHAAAHMRLGQALLAQLDCKAGWPEYEWRFRLPGIAPMMPATTAPKWDGTNCAEGTLLVVAGEGFGDTIQWARFVPEVERRCRDLVIACSKEMRPIIVQQRGVTRTFQEWSDMPAFDAWCVLTSVPGLLGIEIATHRPNTPYVFADKSRSEAWRGRLADLIPPGLLRVGLAWAGRPTHPNDRRRSIDFKHLLPLTAVPGVALISLQKVSSVKLPIITGPAPFFDLTGQIDDFIETAAAIDNFDLVISIDSAMAHLAGAMGKPVWLLLSYAADWRWLTGRNDTPWYPDTRIFRQREPGNWAGVIASVVEQLRRFV